MAETSAQPGGYERSAVERGLSWLASRISESPGFFAEQTDLFARYFFVTNKDMWSGPPAAREVLAPADVRVLQAMGVKPAYIDALLRAGIVEVVRTSKRTTVVARPSTFDALEEAFKMAGLKAPLPPREERERIIRETLAAWGMSMPAPAPQPAAQAAPQAAPPPPPPPPPQPQPAAPSQEAAELRERLERLKRCIAQCLNAA